MLVGRVDASNLMNSQFMANSRKRNTRKLIRDLKIFDDWGKQFTLREPGLVGQVRCPICWRVYDRDALLTSELTREHVISTAVRSLTREPTLLGLTCRDCNNRAGSIGHRPMRDLIEAKPFMFGKFSGPIQATVSFDKQPEQRIELSVEDEKISMVGVSSRNDPRIVKQISDHLERLVKSGSTDWGFDLHINFGVLTPRAWYGYLYSAY